MAELSAPTIVDNRFERADGSPFLWLGDTWWWGASDRITDVEFEALARQRAAQGFTVIQIVIGPGSDAATDDPRQRNAGGRVWLPDGSLNAGYLDVAEARVRMLVDNGLVPCIVGGWGYHLESVGFDRMRELWRALIERFAALPVIWCAAGEALMPYYDLLGGPHQAAHIDTLREGWQQLTAEIRAMDAFGRPLSVHPSAGVGHLATTDMVDASLVDFIMLQTGHAGYASIEPTLTTLEQTLVRYPGLPVVQTEVCYEGIMGASWQELQRFLFWSQLFSGAAGYTYGAQGLWGFDTGGAGDLGARWGRGSWREAADYPGAEQLGLARRLLDDHGWSRLTPAPSRVAPVPAAGLRARPYAAETAGGALLVYVPSPATAITADGERGLTIAGLGGTAGGTTGGTAGRTDDYTARWIDLRSGAESAPVRLEVDDAGLARLPGDAMGVAPTTEDWMLVVEPSA